MRNEITTTMRIYRIGLSLRATVVIEGILEVKKLNPALLMKNI